MRSVSLKRAHVTIWSTICVTSEVYNSGLYALATLKLTRTHVGSAANDSGKRRRHRSRVVDRDQHGSAAAAKWIGP